jgi:hypothetical protein
VKFGKSQNRTDTLRGDRRLIHCQTDLTTELPVSSNAINLENMMPLVPFNPFVSLRDLHLAALVMLHDWPISGCQYAMTTDERARKGCTYHDHANRRLFDNAVSAIAQ